MDLKPVIISLVMRGVMVRSIDLGRMRVAVRMRFGCRYGLFVTRHMRSPDGLRQQQAQHEQKGGEATHRGREITVSRAACNDLMQVVIVRRHAHLA